MALGRSETDGPPATVPEERSTAAKAFLDAGTTDRIVERSAFSARLSALGSAAKSIGVAFFVIVTT
jgi:hypothetical protein